MVVYTRRFNGFMWQYEGKSHRIKIERGDYMKFFVEIDAEKYQKWGEVAIISPPKELDELLAENFRTVPRGGFEIHRKEQLCRFVRVVGGQRGAVAEEILRKKDNRNCLLATNREISANTGVSLATVNNVLQDLRRENCIKSRTAALMLNPAVSRLGNRQREAYLLDLYNHFERKEKSV